MPRWSSNPDTVEDCRVLNISDIKERGYLDSSRTGTINWFRSNQAVASIGVSSIIQEDAIYIRINYTITSRYSDQSKDHRYLIRLEAVPSNLGIGYRYYFICPFTDKRCSKLYMPSSSSVFAHRNYWKDLYYENQIKTKNWRGISSYFDNYKRLKEIETHYMKNFYRGKPTPRFLRYMRLLNKLEGQGEIVKSAFGF